jgi:hypothetical protein
MKANELRIGNLVQYEPTIDDWEETIITTHTLLQVDISSDSYCGIPLTGEWLEKFGFEQREFDIQKYDCKWSNFSFSLDYWNAQKIYIYGWIGGNITIKYVHQLQNLYFALTGEELTIKKEI